MFTSVESSLQSHSFLSPVHLCLSHYIQQCRINFINEVVYHFRLTLKAFHDFIFLSFDYESAGYQAADLIKMDFLLNGRPVEELTTVVHRYCVFQIIP